MDPRSAGILSVYPQECLMMAYLHTLPHMSVQVLGHELIFRNCNVFRMCYTYFLVETRLQLG